MFKQAIPVAVAAALMLTMAGCSGNDRGGGGGGGKGNDMNSGSGMTRTEQTRANMPGDNMSAEGKGYAEAYSRVAWVHSNLVARDWERALDDLHYVRDHVDDLLKDNDVPKDVKTGLTGLKADIAKLDTAIQKHDVNAAKQSKMLLDRFAMGIEKATNTAWLGEHKGGGAGTGNKMEHKK